MPGINFFVHGDRVVEKVSFSFSRIHTSVYLSGGGTTVFCWDVVANQRC